MNNPQDMQDKEMHPYGAIEEDRDAQQYNESARIDRDVSDNARVPTQAAPAPIAKPSARTLARGFRSFRPSVFLQKYRAVKTERRENFRARQPYQANGVGQDEQRKELSTTGWKGRLTQILTRLTPLAALIGNWHLLDMGIMPLLAIFLFMVACVCLGGVAIVSLIRG